MRKRLTPEHDGRWAGRTGRSFARVRLDSSQDYTDWVRGYREGRAERFNDLKAQRILPRGSDIAENKAFLSRSKVLSDLPN